MPLLVPPLGGRLGTRIGVAVAVAVFGLTGSGAAAGTMTAGVRGALPAAGLVALGGTALGALTLERRPRPAAEFVPARV